MVQKNLFLIKNGNPVRTIRHENIKHKGPVKITPLDALQMSLYFFALAVFEDRYILLTGGYCVGAQKKVYLFDVDQGSWVSSPSFPPLLHERQHHSSCATADTAFVFAGFESSSEKPVLALETISLLRDSNGELTQRSWTQTKLPKYLSRPGLLMAAIDNDSVMILGGMLQQFARSDGVILDARTLKVKC